MDGTPSPVIENKDKMGLLGDIFIYAKVFSQSKSSFPRRLLRNIADLVFGPQPVPVEQSGTVSVKIEETMRAKTLRQFSQRIN